MKKDNVLKYKNPTENTVTDVLTEFLRDSAQQMLKVAIEEEVNSFIEMHKSKHLTNGCQQVVRNGYLPKRKIQTGIGDVEVKMPRVRDKGKEGIKFTSNLVPTYMRRTVTLEVLLPLLYLKGISTTDFADCFEPILGSKPKNMSPNVISNLKSGWYDEYEEWQKRDLSTKEYVYFWVDGIYLQARMESEKNCILVIIGADSMGKKEVVAIYDGFRESKESWQELLIDLKSRGLRKGPRLAVGDGALGFWGAMTEVYPETEHQRCWVHKTANILNKLPKSQQTKAKSMLHEIYMAENLEDAEKALKKFISTYNLKYPKAVECLLKDQKELLKLYEFPAEHWVHLRTTNPIESTFATVKHRTKKSKNCFSRNTIIAAVFKLCKEAEKRWKALRSKNRIAQVIQLHRFIDGIHEDEINERNDLHFNIDNKHAA